MKFLITFVVQLWGIGALIQYKSMFPERICILHDLGSYL